LKTLTSLAIAWLLSGCATTTTREFRWPTLHADARELKQRYPRASAVVIRDEDHYDLTYDSSAPPRRMERYVAMAILAEGGEKYADVKIPVDAGEMLFLHARTTDPDGTTQEVTPEEVHEETERGGSEPEYLLVPSERKVKVFRLPGVRVGSIIECAYAIVDYHLTDSLRQKLEWPIPTQHYRLEISVSGLVDLNFRLYNAEATIHKQEGSGRKRAVIEMDDLPGTRVEPLAPPTSLTEPWWLIVLQRLATPRRMLNAHTTWADTLTPLGFWLYIDDDKFYGGVKLKPELAGCERGTLCAIERALIFVNAETDLTKFVSSLDQARPLKEVLASRTANNMEKTLLLRRALEAVGVPSRFAVIARNRNNDFDPLFPAPGSFDHLILYVDTVPGLTAPVFLDPSCEYCEVGEIPPWIRDRAALVFKTKRGYSELYETSVAFMRTPSDAAGMASDRRNIEVQLELSGAVHGRMMADAGGQEAVDMHAETRAWLDDDWRVYLERLLHRFSQAAELCARVPQKWDKRDAVLALGADFAVDNYASVDGERLIVPLTLLHGLSDETLGGEPRVHDLMIDKAVHEEETVTFRLPSGYEATSLPRAVHIRTEAVDALFSVSATPGLVRVKRMVELHVGRWPPAAFNDVVDVFRGMAALRQQAFVVQRAH
jgi:hypothetical protein